MLASNEANRTWALAGTPAPDQHVPAPPRGRQAVARGSRAPATLNAHVALPAPSTKRTTTSPPGPIADIPAGPPPNVRDAVAPCGTQLRRAATGITGQMDAKRVNAGGARIKIALALVLVFVVCVAVALARSPAVRSELAARAGEAREAFRVAVVGETAAVGAVHRSVRDVLRALDGLRPGAAAAFAPLRGAVEGLGAALAALRRRPRRERARGAAARALYAAFKGQDQQLWETARAFDLEGEARAGTADGAALGRAAGAMYGLLRNVNALGASLPEGGGAR